MRVNTHGERVWFGKHKGELWTRVPVSYLRWIVNVKLDATNKNRQRVCDIARAELKRRGSKLPKVELSGHAIDNASLRILDVWLALRNKNEGLYSWLERITLEAIANGERLDGGKVKYMQMKLVIEQGEEFPVLKTIM